MRVEVRQPSRGGRALSGTPADLEALQGAGALSHLGVFAVREATVSTPEVGASRVALAEMTAEVFDLLRVNPLMGRIPSTEEAGAGFVLGFDLWTEAFESDPDILGKPVTVAGDVRTVSAVMPEGFKFPFRQSAWTVLPTDEISGDVEIVGRLVDAASTESLSMTKAVSRLWGLRPG